ncbi:MAG: HAMP domain-containing sensor histidine kinase [Spirochaetota bacterium]
MKPGREKRMKTRRSYYMFLIKIVSLLAAGFLLVNIVMWVYYRANVRSIGHYLFTGRVDEAASVIADYLGAPPSRLKAWFLSRVYNVVIVYTENGKISWIAGDVEKGSASGRSRNTAPGHMTRMRKMMPGMSSHTMHRMLSMHYRETQLGQNRVVSIYIPPNLKKRNYLAPFFFTAVIVGLVVTVVFLSVKKTLGPLDRIMEASERIGKGDLSYRIPNTRNTQFGKVAEAFNTMTEKLGAMLGTQRELLHLISHELRSPLARINVALEMKDKQRSSRIIKQEVQEIDGLVGKVLELSRIDYVNPRESADRFQLDEVLRKIIQKYPEGVIQFTSAVGSSSITANAVLVEKAFSNLIDNAVKYSDKHRPVVVELSHQAGEYQVVVQNSGPGIPEEEQDKIWQPFFRGTASQKKNVEGKGLGLVIVQKAVKASEGKIFSQSSRQGPTVFRVRLPQTPPTG